MGKQLFFFLVFLAVFGGRELYSQDVAIVRSEITEHIDGKAYYLHTVEQGHTLYAISKVYEVPVDELIFENAAAADGLSIGQVLRIPVVSREKIITEDLRDGEFRYIFHIVRKGETLFAISRIYEVAVDDLKAANPGWEAGLREGQYLKIPLGDNTQDIAAGTDMHAGFTGKIHVVSSGETLYSISRKYQVGIPGLKAANPGISTNLSPGQKVRIPETPEEDEVAQQPKYYEHTVAGKETLFGIARKYRISVDSLMAFNPGLTQNIFPGEVIRIPAAPNPETVITHEVREKTKLKTIASKYAVSIADIKEVNPDFRSRVRPGDLLFIPVGPPADTFPEGELIVEVPDDRPPPIIKNDSLSCYLKKPHMARTLKVALMVPLYTEEARHIDIEGVQGTLRPENYKPFNFIQFYEGFLMALDDLRDQGLNVSLYVYDVDEKVSKTIKVLQQPELTEMDLIVGPFFSRNFTLVSNFAEMFGIKIVNPLTRRTEVLSNPLVFKMKPSRDVQPSLLAEFIEKYHQGSNIILVRNNKFQYEEEIRQIRASLEKGVPWGVKVPNAALVEMFREFSAADSTLARGELISSMMIENRMVYAEELLRSPADSTFFPNGIAEVIYAVDSINGIIRNASVARENLVIALTNNEVFAPEILTRLNDLKDTFDITVVGMPEWELLDNLETDYLLGLNVYFFSASYYDFDDPEVLRFIHDFRERYKTHPNEYAFEGYDIAKYFMEAMMRFGPDCEDCLQYYPAKLLKTNIKMTPAYPAGFENLYWNICRYHNYRVLKVNDQ
jgi:LysM repeat protein